MLVFLGKKTPEFSQKWAKFMNFSFWPFLWFGLLGRLLTFANAAALHRGQTKSPNQEKRGFGVKKTLFELFPTNPEKGSLSQKIPIFLQGTTGKKSDFLARAALFRVGGTWVFFRRNPLFLILGVLTPVQDLRARKPKSPKTKQNLSTMSGSASPQHPPDTLNWTLFRCSLRILTDRAEGTKMLETVVFSGCLVPLNGITSVASRGQESEKHHSENTVWDPQVWELLACRSFPSNLDAAGKLCKENGCWKIGPTFPGGPGLAGWGDWGGHP